MLPASSRCTSPKHKHNPDPNSHPNLPKFNQLFSGPYSTYSQISWKSNHHFVSHHVHEQRNKQTNSGQSSNCRHQWRNDISSAICWDFAKVLSYCSAFYLRYFYITEFRLILYKQNFTPVECHFVYCIAFHISTLYWLFQSGRCVLRRLDYIPVISGQSPSDWVPILRQHRSHRLYYLIVCRHSRIVGSHTGSIGSFHQSTHGWHRSVFIRKFY